MTHIASALKETHREIGRRRIPAGEAYTAVMRRHYDASINKVWSAITDPEEIQYWFIKPTGKLKAGGNFKLEGNSSGDILRCEPPRKFTLSWKPEGTDRVDEVEVRLTSPKGGGTDLELEHASVAKDFTENDPDTGEWGVGPGWESALDYLGAYLRGDLPDAPAAEWYQPTEEDMKAASQRGKAWAKVVDNALNGKKKAASAKKSTAKSA